MGKISISIFSAGLLLGSGLVTGCGSDDDGGGGNAGGDYCKTLKSAASNVRSFTAKGATPDFAKIQDFLDTAHDLADEAPSEVKDDWTVVLGAMDSLTSALEEAGIKLEDFGDIIATGQLPEGVDPAKLTALTGKLQAIGNEKVTKAGEAISKHAKDDCDVDLSKAS
jgi:hypothetical protein